MGGTPSRQHLSVGGLEGGGGEGGGLEGGWKEVVEGGDGKSESEVALHCESEEE